MRRARGRVIHVDSLEDFDHRIASGARSLSGWRLRGLDLTDRGRALRSVDVAEALFLGCRLSAQDEVSVRARGAVVFPQVPDSPVEDFRSSLYRPQDLYDVRPYAESMDARVFAWSQRRGSRQGDLSQALHDHSISLALEAWIKGRRLVGLMGGHGALRGSDSYAAGAHLGWLLGQTHTVATGGGPGAMEAANLGAYLSTHGADAVPEALQLLSGAPDFHPDIDAWVRSAWEVRDLFPAGAESLGIPTWHYGHEPPNVFATAVAKFFRNAQREAILLEICQAGIVFLPGAGGTVQEIFQDACENYYADESSTAPMVLVGQKYWTQELPAWPLLKALARGRAMQEHIHLVDTVEDAAQVVTAVR